ncbi:MAG: amidohydrolase [Desulfatitalea sp.]|nr:amidohydrolase [Desulfatitalea sp.]
MKVFKNATFISCEDDNRVFSHMVEDQGRILFAGDHLPHPYAGAETVDLEGRCVVPAFGDSHMHFTAFGFFNTGLDCRNATDFDAFTDMVRRHISDNPQEKIVVGFGCSAHTVKEKRLPTRDDLDAITRQPLMIVKYDGHAAVGNSALLSKLPKAIIEETGCEPATGWLYHNAFYKAVNQVNKAVPLTRVFRNHTTASDYVARKGIALIHASEGIGFPLNMDLDMMRFVARGLPVTIRVFFQTMDVAKAKRRKLPRIGGCFTTALDGCFGSEDAALNAPYTHRPDSHGMLTYTQQATTDFVKAAHRQGLQVALHAIGDAAIEQALNAFEAAQVDFPRSDHRHILIHACMIDPPLIEKAARLGVCFALQTPFFHWDQEPMSYLEQILGKRAQRLTPLKSMLAQGLTLANGSDAPCTLPDPIAGIHAACNHPNPDESISALEALRMHTASCAKLSFDEKTRGTLTSGKRADFVVLDQDPLTMPTHRLKEIQVEKLYREGTPYDGLHNSALTLLKDALINKYP